MNEPQITLTPIALDDCHNWRAGRDEDDLVWLAFDCADASTNTLSERVLTEFGGALDAIIAERPRGLIVYSAKDNGFAAGADIREFDDMTEPEQTAARIDEVHQLFGRLEKLAFPTVARVHGFCLGGGLELALACRHIVADDASSTRIGLPEILLGIHPGFGGTVRAVRDCGAPAALDLMLTGRSLNARRAKKIGLVDRAVARRHLDAAARHFATTHQPRRKPPRHLQLTSARFARPAVAAFVRRAVAKRAPEAHYPAPYAVINLWREHGGDPAAMYRAEARSIASLLLTPTSRNLVRMFRLQERLKGIGGERPQGDTHVHVVGAGTMGGDIAAWCAARGMRVTLQDREPRFLAPALQRAAKFFAKRIRDPYERLAARDRLIPDFNGDGVTRADVIIEAIIEDVEAKQALFAELESKARPDALLATNTSSIQLTDIASTLASPERLVGIHFFNPVQQMQLVEIISSEQTDAEVQARAAGFTAAIDRLPLPARSAPGFLVNRVLSPYLQEAMTMLEEGVSAATIDAAAVSFGMPMGPIELADTVGLDICLHVGEILSAAYGGDVPAILRRKVTQKELGKKSGRGFYTYKKGKKEALKDNDGDAVPAAAEIRDRMVLRLVNEAAACLADGIVTDSDLLDVGMVFGTGFAPFRGGPLHYAKERGIVEVTERLQQLERQYGERFAPHPGLAAL